MWYASPLLFQPRDSLTNKLLSAVIQSVTVASYPAEFVHCDPVANLNVSNPSDCHRFSELKRKLYSALAEGDEGELSIAIPKEVPIRLVPKENRGQGYGDGVSTYSGPPTTSDQTLQLQPLNHKPQDLWHKEPKTQGQNTRKF